MCVCVCGGQVVNVLEDATEAFFFFFHVLSLQKLIALLYLFEGPPCVLYGEKNYFLLVLYKY